jgi:hypothetical protein
MNTRIRAGGSAACRVPPNGRRPGPFHSFLGVVVGYDDASDLFVPHPYFVLSHLSPLLGYVSGRNDRRQETENLFTMWGTLGEGMWKRSASFPLLRSSTRFEKQWTTKSGRRVAPPFPVALASLAPTEWPSAGSLQVFSFPPI